MQLRIALSKMDFSLHIRPRLFYLDKLNYVMDYGVDTPGRMYCGQDSFPDFHTRFFRASSSVLCRDDAVAYGTHASTPRAGTCKLLLCWPP